MWTRADLKQRAKQVLKESYWKAFLVSIIISIAGGGKTGFNFNLNSFNSGRNRGSSYGIHMDSFINFFSNPRAILALIISTIIFTTIILLIIAFRVFLGYALEIGGRRFYIQSAQGNTDLNNICFAFNRASYLDIIKTMLWRAVINFLWYLLFIIPGIVKAFAYSMVPYILADNPNIGYRRALELSNEMTDGHKFRIFVLGLSFIGWYLLGMLALLVGTIFVVPYQYATMAELYLTLRNNALEYGWCTHEELNLVRQLDEGETI